VTTHLSFPADVDGVVDARIHVLGPVLQARFTEVHRQDATVKLHVPRHLQITSDGKDGTARPIGGHQVRRPTNNVTQIQITSDGK